ncbi:MAG: hypothetical protein ACKOEO_14055, partial [Planctomycetaceae bacterium]
MFRFASLPLILPTWGLVALCLSLCSPPPLNAAQQPFSTAASDAAVPPDDVLSSLESERALLRNAMDSLAARNELRS